MADLLTVSEAAGTLLNLAELTRRYSEDEAKAAVREMTAAGAIGFVKMRGRLYVPREELGLTVVRAFAACLAEARLAAHAAEAGMTPDAYRLRGLDIEWHHQVDYPAVPCSPYLQLGEAS